MTPKIKRILAKYRLKLKRKLGSGAEGSVFKTNKPDVVCKIGFRDGNSEEDTFARVLLRHQKAGTAPPCFPKIHAVRALGGGTYMIIRENISNTEYIPAHFVDALSDRDLTKPGLPRNVKQTIAWLLEHGWYGTDIRRYDNMGRRRRSRCVVIRDLGYFAKEAKEDK